MALDTTGFPSAQIALTLTDYTTPTPLTVPVALVGDTILPQERPQESNSQFENTASGKAHVGELVNGQGPPPTGSFSFYEIDTADNAEVTSPVGCVRALSQNSVAGTAFSSHNFSSQLTRGGKLQVKGVFAIYNEGGVTHTKTIPLIITDFVESIADGARLITANYKVVGAITDA